MSVLEFDRRDPEPGPVVKQDDYGYGSVQISVVTSAETLRGALDKLSEVASEAASASKSAAPTFLTAVDAVVDAARTHLGAVEDLRKAQEERARSQTTRNVIKALMKNVGARIRLT